MCQRLPLTSFLILPFQRITRLKMLVEVPRGRAGPARSQGEGVACLILESHLQNILKRTAQGSQDEDMATKAFNALKEVSSVGQGYWAPDRLSWTPSMSLTEPPAVGVSDPWAEA